MTTLSVCAGPKISTSSALHDFGATNQPNHLRHTFTVANNGDETLIIKKVRACCGATATMSLQQLEPGKQATVDVTLLTDSKTGEIKKTIHLETNDPGAPFFPLTLSVTRPDATSNGKGTTASNSAPAIQSDCPFKAEPIQKQYFHDHKGQRIYTCCPECLVIVKNRPELALRHLAAKGQVPIAVPTEP